MKFFLCVIGMVLIIEGLPYFGFPQQVKNMLAMISEMEENSLRRIGFALMICGLILVYTGKCLLK